MLQQVEYNPHKFHAWFIRLLSGKKKLTHVMHRQKLVMTHRATLLVTASYAIIFVHILLSIFLFFVSVKLFALHTVFLLIILPYELELFLLALATFAHKFIIIPEQKKQIAHAQEIFAKHNAVKVAVLGSYGKTTMKEILHTVLKQHFRVAITPGNMNVTASHAKFARSLTGDEEVIIVEFGEGEPGDIARMAKMFSPDYAFVTGLAPNHLDEYPDIDSIATDLLTIYDFVERDKVYVNSDSIMLQRYILEDMIDYSQRSALDLRVSNVKLAVDSLSFTLSSSKKTIKVTSHLLGEHQIGPLSIVASFALMLGATIEHVEQGLAMTTPFEHRMQPRMLNGAWIIDDTYNGNLEGMQAGLKLLQQLDAKRRWYVTPGLVDQGSETERVHEELGKAIAEARPDIVVLMKNSVNTIIQQAMTQYGFTGELRIDDSPLDFYMNIEHQVATGDIVLMQNDWTDNYN